jgi:hypothetical protein
LEKQALKNILYGSIAELANDRRYYHYSEFGQRYCYYTDDGEKAVMEILQTWTHKVLEAERASLDKRAKELVLKELKSE